MVGEWVGREEYDADPLAAEMLHPPVPRVKTEVYWSSRDNSPARRSATGRLSFVTVCIANVKQVHDVQTDVHVFYCRHCD